MITFIGMRIAGETVVRGSQSHSAGGLTLNVRCAEVVVMRIDLIDYFARAQDGAV